jgi:phosphopantothenoylcysteine decarboxylase / phosphopantothenate---cysteine ligase
MSETAPLAGKHVLIGITGGIAAYKICNVVRLLKQEGADVRVALTRSGARFSSIPTLEVLSQNEVYTTLWPEDSPTSTVHIDLGRWADAVLIAPATANILAKAALGLADDLLSTILLSLDPPVIFAPTMNDKMYQNAVVQEHMRNLMSRGHLMIEPGIGDLACDTVGVGRMAEPETLVAAVEHQLLGRRDMVGLRVLVTAGPTREPLDPVRYLSNASSGRMGYALAAEAALRGAEVTLVAGPSSLFPPPVAELVDVETGSDMAKAVYKRSSKQDVMVFAAAVSDYRPAVVGVQKMKKTGKKASLKLEPNEDIAATVGKRKGRKTLVGFALETEQELKNAARKLKSKNLDLIVVNNPLEPGAGFETDTNIVQILDAGGDVQTLPLQHKSEVARNILDRVMELRNAKRKR